MSFVAAGATVAHELMVAAAMQAYALSALPWRLTCCNPQPKSLEIQLVKWVMAIFDKHLWEQDQLWFPAMRRNTA